MAANYESTSRKYFTSDLQLDYSTDPDDKILAKFSAEKLQGKSGQAILNVYHKDLQHLDFVVKANRSLNLNEESLGLMWTWKNSKDQDQEIYVLARYPSIDKNFHFVYHRPHSNFEFESTVVTPPSLLGEISEINLTSTYNGEKTKGKLVVDYGTGCYLLTIFDSEGKKSRLIKMCHNPQNRKFFSLMTESVDEDGEWTFDYSLEILHKSLGLVNIRHHWNPEFLGGLVFQLTSLADELMEAGVGSVSLYSSPRFKSLRKSFASKVIEPAVNFLTPESQQLWIDLQEDMEFPKEKLKEYLNLLPSSNTVVRHAENFQHLLEEAFHRAVEFLDEYFRENFGFVISHVEKITEKLKEQCANYLDCRHIMRAYNTAGWKGISEEFKNIFFSLPERIQQFFSNPENYEDYIKRVKDFVKTHLQQLNECRCGEIVVKVSKLMIDALYPHVESIISKAPQYFRQAIKAIVEMEQNQHVQRVIILIKNEVHWLQEELAKLNYEKLYHVAKEYLEHFLMTASLPSAKRYFTINTINSERGILDLDIHFLVDPSIIKKILTILESRLDHLLDAPNRYNWNKLLIKFKRGADLNFLPPYSEQALIVDQQYFTTFDKTFFEFAGECSYLLSRDFEDGNFTIALKPNDKSTAEKSSIVVLLQSLSIEINTADKSVIINENAAELPYVSEDVYVTRVGSNILVDDHGLHVKCSLAYQLCTFTISGWYYGKVAGMLGTYNYEPSDDFKRPKGQIANTPTVFAKSWELKRGCKSANLIPDVQVNKNSDYYKLCEEHFHDSTSPLSACFSEVKPDDYLSLCLHYLARNSDTKKAFCNVAAAYVSECEKNYVDLNLPRKCLTCEAPGGAVMQHGDRKKIENVKAKSADIVFIVEDHTCNKVIVPDLNHLARSIDRELQNEGFKDNMYGLVGFGGPNKKPAIYTAHGEVLFPSKDINAVTERLKLQGDDGENLAALDAMKLAITYLFRSEATKTFILLSCTPCKYDYKSLQYPVIQQILLERGISLHVITKDEIKIRKSSYKDKGAFIGADPDTVYNVKDATQKDLVGEPELRSQVALPKDLCVTLSQDVNGSFFSTHTLSKSSANDAKNWRSVFARKFIKSVQVHQCQLCDCTSMPDYTASSICQPCEIKRPRLPFSLYLTSDVKYF